MKSEDGEKGIIRRHLHLDCALVRDSAQLRLLAASETWLKDLSALS
jgi:hypothetical protein